MTFIPPAGYPLSAYTPPNVGALPPPPGILADRWDPKHNDIVSLVEGDDPTDAALQWQFTIRQGSGAALGDNGHRLHTITKATEQAPTQLRDEARRVCQKFEARGDITNVRIEAAQEGGSTAIAAVVVHRTNVHTEQSGKTIGGA